LSFRPRGRPERDRFFAARSRRQRRLLRATARTRLRTAGSRSAPIVANAP